MSMAGVNPWMYLLFLVAGAGIGLALVALVAWVLLRWLVRFLDRYGFWKNFVLAAIVLGAFSGCSGVPILEIWSPDTKWWGDAGETPALREMEDRVGASRAERAAPWMEDAGAGRCAPSAPTD